MSSFCFRLVEPKASLKRGVNARGVGMLDDEGFSVPGELQIGGYAALEGDLGESLCGPLGFSAPPVEWEADGLSFAAAGFSTVRAQVAFVVRGVS